MRLAVLGPMPGIVAIFLTSSLSIAWANSSTLIVRSAAERRRRSDPGRRQQQLEELAVLGVEKPKRWIASSRTTVKMKSSMHLADGGASLDAT